MVAFIYYLLYRLKHILALPSDIDKQVAISRHFRPCVLNYTIFSYLLFKSFCDFTHPNSSDQRFNELTLILNCSAICFNDILGLLAPN